MKNRCTWCADPRAEEDDGTLCLGHLAEYEGLSVAEYERRDGEQYAEYLDTIG